MKKIFLIVSIIAGMSSSFAAEAVGAPAAGATSSNNDPVKAEHIGAASAVSSAMGTIPQVPATKKFAFGMGGSYFNASGQNNDNVGSGAFAIGVSATDSRNTVVFNLRAGVGFESHKWEDVQKNFNDIKTATFGFSTGLSFNFGTNNGQLLKSKSYDSKIAMLEKENKELRAMFKNALKQYNINASRLENRLETVEFSK